MCLTTVTKKYQIPSNQVKEGFKVIIDNYWNASCFQVPVYNDTYYFDEWLTASGNNIYAADGTCYPSGFHIFTKYYDAQDYRDKHYPNGRVVLVRYAGIQTIGTQDGLKVLVAKKMYCSFDQLQMATATEYQTDNEMPW